MKLEKAVLLVVLLAVQTAVANTTTVTSTADSGAGTLRAALASTANGDTINLSVTGAITLTSGELVVTRNVTITGPGPSHLAVNGNHACRVFHIGSNTVVSISGLSINNGSARYWCDTALGGGIWNNHATLTVSNCVLSGNLADFGGGGIGNFGIGASGNASLTIINTTLSGNSSDQGGGILNDGGRGGSASLQIVNSTLSGNSARLGGGILNSVFTSGMASLQIVNSTLSGNTATELGGGIDNANLGGSAASVSIFNSTLSGDSARAGGCIINIGEYGPTNRTEYGPANLEIGSSILKAGLGGNIVNFSGKVASDGYNLSSDDGGGFFAAIADEINTDPMLGPLQDNGGPTFTHALAYGSLAIDQGKNFSASPTDQRGPGFARTIANPGVASANG